MSKLPVQFDNASFQRLTPREQAFVMHPEVYTNPMKAAEDVGYTANTARCKSHIMRHQLMYYIMPLQEQRMEAANITAERIVNELACIAFADETQFYDTIDIEGETVKVVKDFTRMPESMRRAIKSIELGNIVLPDGTMVQTVTKIQLYDKQAALRELKEIAGLNDPRFRKPPEKDNADEALMSQLEPDELELVARMYAKASDRATAASNKKRDARAIPGKRTKE